MVCKAIYTRTAEKDLGRLERKQSQKIIKKIKEYCNSGDPLLHAKKLKNFEIATYRFRIGKYRVIFRLDPQTEKVIILVVLKVAHRKDVYRSIS